jgi:hypothetical protein
MGSTAAGSPQQPRAAKAALEFQAIVDKLFAIGGFRSESEESPVKLARPASSRASTDEIDEIARLSEEALHEADSSGARLGRGSGGRRTS